MKIRKGTFETNSSSTHSIAISKDKIDIPKGITIRFNIGEYGWKERECDFPSYMYTALLEYDDENAINKLKSILNSWGANYKFATPKWEYYNDSKYLQNGDIDHSYEAYSIVLKILDNKDLLARALFGDSTVYTGNDNGSDSDNMCYCAKEYVWDEKTLKKIPNPNHIPNKYDYFFKGN